MFDGESGKVRVGDKSADRFAPRLHRQGAWAGREKISQALRVLAQTRIVTGGIARRRVNQRLISGKPSGL
jgi:hypothetical protein